MKQHLVWIVPGLAITAFFKLVSQVRRAYAVMGDAVNEAALYAGRVAGYRRTPPPAGWDGITAFDEK